MSKALVDAKTHYSQVEQTTLALCVAVKKLYPYFQAHQVTILINQPLRITFHKSDPSRRMMKWAIELSEYGIQYKPRLSLKGQVLIDFIVELPQKQVQIDTTNHWWNLHVDGASRTSGTGVGVALLSPIGE